MPSKVLGFVELDRSEGSVEIGPPGQTGDESWHVLAGPEGNEFCLLRRRLLP